MAAATEGEKAGTVQREKLQAERKNIALKAQRAQSSRPLGARVPASLDALSFEPGTVFREERKKYTDPTEGAFLAGLGPPTHGSLFKPPPILYSSVRGGLLTQPDSTHNKTWTSILYGGGRTRTHAHTHGSSGHCGHTITYN